MARPELADFALCPCGCGGVSIGKGLTKRGHVPYCGTPRSGADRPCHICQGRRNRAKGQRNQALTHRRLGGEGPTPHDEESARPYIVEVCIMPEAKTGDSIPRSWDRFIEGEWFRRALRQSERAAPVGAGVLPAVSLRGEYVVVDIRPVREGR